MLPFLIYIILLLFVLCFVLRDKLVAKLKKYCEYYKRKDLHCVWYTKERKYSAKYRRVHQYYQRIPVPHSPQVTQHTSSCKPNP